MDELNNLLSQIMSDPASMQQIQAMASSLGLGDGGANALPPAQQDVGSANSGSGLDLSALQSMLGSLSGGSSGDSAAPAQPEQNAGGLDLSALSSLLGGGQAQQQPQPAANSTPDLSALASLLGGAQSGGNTGGTGGTPDLSSLASLLGNAQGGDTGGGGNGSLPDLSALSGLIGGLTGSNSGNQGKADLSALTALLNSGNPQGAAPTSSGLPFDMGTLLKLQKAMASLGNNRGNVDLLLALKPRLKEDRAKKVDDAIRVMQLIQFLPLIKETGLFGDFENILSGTGSGLGGLGSLVGGLGDGIGGLLGNLFGGRR